jgi:hypothetical protein
LGHYEGIHKEHSILLKMKLNSGIPKRCYNEYEPK